MKTWCGWLIGLAMAATAIGQNSAPVLSGISAPNVPLQMQVTMAGHNYSRGEVSYGPVGTPLILAGSNLGDSGAVWFISYKNGAVDSNVRPVPASVLLWSPTEIVTSVPAAAKSGLIVVTSGSVPSNGLPFIVMSGTYSGVCPAGPPAGTLQIATTSLSDGAINHSYSAQLQATGGSGSYTWTLVDGTLPAGLTLSASGTIAGMPTASGNAAYITVQVADGGAPRQYDVATFSLTVNVAPEGTSSADLYNYSIADSSGSSGYDAAGNIVAYNDSVNGMWSFGYDPLNRLSTALGSQGDNPYPNYCWQYDAYGNRLAQSSGSQPFAAGSGGANACPIQGAAGATQWAQYNASNRMTATSQNSNQGQNYDDAGDIVYDGLNQYLYDAEGRICAVQMQIPGIGASMTQYIYDAEGRRVAKGMITSWSCDSNANGFTPTMSYLLGLGGEQLSEWTNTTGAWQPAHTNVYASGMLVATYDADLSGQSSGHLYFHLSDWLGTRRQQTDYAGNPLLNFIGLPFGDGLSTIPVSTAAAADATEHHFTAKERDNESGNDYFGARYYASSMGRWLSPDWSAKATPVPYAKLSNPQSLNLYAYVYNNPLDVADPDGHWVPLSDDEKLRAKQLAGLKSAVGAQAGAYLYDNVVDGKHYVGIYTNGPDGKGPSFESINNVSKQFGAIIGDQAREASIQFVSPGTKINGHTVGAMDAGQSPAVTTLSKDGKSATVNLTSGSFGEMNGLYTSNGRSTWISSGDVFSHEFGHIFSAWYQGDAAGVENSVRMENETRQMENGPIRMFHTKPGDAGATTF